MPRLYLPSDPLSLAREVVDGDVQNREQASKRSNHALHALDALVVLHHPVLDLAEPAGLPEAHISNFLNKKRALSLDGLDRVLEAQELSIEQLLKPDRVDPLLLDTAKYLPIDIAASEQSDAPHPVHLAPDRTPPDPDPISLVPVVAPSTAADAPHVPASLVIETVPVAASVLSELRARSSRKSAVWERFVAIRINAQQAAEMPSVLAPGAIAIIDRHYNSLAPYRADQTTLYAVRYGPGLLLRFVEFDGGRLILRPASVEHPVHLLVVGPHETPSDLIVGRVCLLVQEL